MAKLKRVNARISSDLDRLVQELSNAKGLSVSDIIVHALKEFCESQAPTQKQSPYQMFQQSGLIGSLNLGRTFSTKYKREYLKSLNKKWS